MASETKTRQWGGVCSETENNITWMQRLAFYLYLFLIKYVYHLVDQLYDYYFAGFDDFLRFWNNGESVLRPAGEAGQER